MWFYLDTNIDSFRLQKGAKYWSYMQCNRIQQPYSCLAIFTKPFGCQAYYPPVFFIPQLDPLPVNRTFLLQWESLYCFFSGYAIAWYVTELKACFSSQYLSSGIVECEQLWLAVKWFCRIQKNVFSFNPSDRTFHVTKHFKFILFLIFWYIVSWWEVHCQLPVFQELFTSVVIQIIIGLTCHIVLVIL